MEIICLDSTVLIEYYRMKDKRESFFFNLSRSYSFKIPSIVKYEILCGDKKKDRFWNNLFHILPVLPFDDECSSIASNIYKELLQRNQMIEVKDIFIGATSIKNNLKIATINIEHFKRIDGLVIIKPF